MGLLFADGFDSYSASADLFRNWSVVDSPWAWVSNAGRNGGGCAQCVGTNNTQSLSTPAGLFTTPNGTLAGYCFWLKISAIPTATGILTQAQTGAAAGMSGLRVNTSTGFLAQGNAGSAGTGTGELAATAGKRRRLAES